MSKRGNDLVRRHLWMAALTASRFNPAVRALYQHVVAKNPEHKAVAVGHAMRKLLHLAFAVWKADRPFDPDHYPWDGPADDGPDEPGEATEATAQAAGHKPEMGPAEKAVTAACADTVGATGPKGEGTYIDFAHLKGQLPMERVPGQLGCCRGCAEAGRSVAAPARCTGATRAGGRSA